MLADKTTVRSSVKDVPLTPLDRIAIDGVEYYWDSDFPGGKLFTEAEGAHRSLSKTDDEIDALIREDRMVVQNDYHSIQDVERRALIGLEYLQTMDSDKLKTALWRQTWVELLLQSGNGAMKGTVAERMAAIQKAFRSNNAASLRSAGKKIQSSNQKIFELEATSARSVARWTERYIDAGCDISALVDKRGGSRTPKFTDEERGIHARFVLKYASLTQPTVRHLRRRMVAVINRLNRTRAKDNQLRAMSETYLRDKIHGLPDMFVMAGRKGSRKARLFFQAARQKAMERRPFKTLEADEWKVDLKTLMIEAALWDELSPEEKKAYESIRLWMSAVIDVATRCVVGFRLHDTAPNIESAFTTFEMTARDKTAIAKAAGCTYPWEMRGHFREVRMDSATWYTSPAVRGVLLDAGCSSIYPPAGEPFLRGTIERFFRTIAFLGLQDFSGRTFSNIVEKGDADPEAGASVNTSKLALILMRLIVDVYHNTAHDGLGGLTPRQAWLFMTKENAPRLEPVGFLRRNIYGTPARRKITKEGICFLGIQYDSEQIQAMRQDDMDQEVDIRVDRYDLSEISVFQGVGFIPVRASLKGLKNVSVWRWEALLNRVNIWDREQRELAMNEYSDAIEWIAEQADLALAELELGSPILTAEHFDRLETRIARFIRVKASGIENERARQKVASSSELAKLFGLVSVLKKKEETQKPAKFKAPERAEAPKPVGPSEVDRNFIIPPDENEF